MTRYAEELLVTCLVSKGYGLDDAKKLVAFILSTAVVAGIVEVRHLEIWEKHASIYHLRGKRVTGSALAERFDMSLAKIYMAVRKHQHLRRAALRQDDPLDLAG